MNVDRTERLIREAFAAEAERAVDTRRVLAELERRRSRSSKGRMTMVAVAAAAVVAAVGGVVVPRLMAGDGVESPAAPVAPADQNVLLAGLDEAGNADAVVLLHLGRNGTAAAVSLPRDSWVRTPSHGMARLGGAYAKARADAIAKGEARAEADQAGARELADTVGNLTGTRVDHYAVVDMVSFGRLSTAVGGVPVCLLSATNDKFSGAVFPAGRQTVSGPAALAFLRQRHGLPRGDFDRMARLQAFLRSLAHELLTGPTLGDERALTAVLDTVRGAVRVDPGWDLLAFTAQLRGLRAGDLRMATIPISDADMRNPEGGGSVVGVAPDEVRSFVRGLSTDTPKAPTPTTGTLPPGYVPCVS